MRPQLAMNRLTDIDISTVRISQTLETNAEMKVTRNLRKSIDANGFRTNLPFDEQIHVFRHKGVDYLVNGHHRKVALEQLSRPQVKGIYLTVEELAEYGVTPAELVRLSEEAIRIGTRIR